jgi:hypothetical protein
MFRLRVVPISALAVWQELFDRAHLQSGYLVSRTDPLHCILRNRNLQIAFFVT